MIRKLVKYFKGYGFWAILAPTLILLEVFLRVYIPRYTGLMIDEGIAKGNFSIVYSLGARMIVIALVSMAMGGGASHAASRAGQGFGANLRMATFANIQRFDFENIDRFSTPSLITRLTNDINRISRMAQMSLRMAVRAPFMLATSLWMALQINKQLSAVFAISIPIVSLAVVFIATSAFKYFRKTQKQLDNLNGTVQENLNAIRIVKSFTREDYEIEKFDKENTDLRDISMKAMFTIIKLPFSMMLTINVTIVAVLYIGTKGILAGTIRPGDLFSFIMYIGQILHSVSMVFMIVLNYARAKASAERILEVLEEEPELDNPADPVYEMDDGSFTIRDLSFQYEGSVNENLSGISLKVDEGETLAIVGSTGSGKTTLIQLLARLYDKKGGELIIGGHPVESYDLKALREQVAIVLQKNTLFRGTIRDNLLWGNPDATDEELWRVLEIAQADTIVKDRPDGLDAPVEQGGSNFSGGQKQRLTIARSLLKQPKIIVFDDSTSALDMETDRRLREALDKALPELTKVIIAQRIDSVQDADKILLLEKGEMDGLGTHDELLADNEIYQEIYESQAQGVGA